MVTTLAKSPIPEATLLVTAPVVEPNPGDLLISSLQWNNLIDILDGVSADKIAEAALAAISISKITNLQTELDGKASLAHSHIIADITGLQAILDAKFSATNRQAAIVNAEIDASAAIALTKIAITGTPDGTKFLRDDGTWQDVGTAMTDHGTLLGLGDDDHTQYQLRTEKDAINGYAGLDGSSKLTGSQQTYGALANTACEGNDSRLSDARTPLAHTHVAADVTDFEAAVSANASVTANTAKVTNATHTGDVTGDTVLAIAPDVIVDADINSAAAISLSKLATDPLARSNHTGAQLASTISDFDASVSGNSAVTANTAKVSNVTHTGDATGDTALTIANDVVDNAKLANVATATIKGRVTAATGDPEDLTATQARTVLNVEDGSTADQSDAEIETAYNNQVPVVSTVDAEAGVSTTVNRWTPQRVAEAIAALESAVPQGLGELATVATGTAQTAITGTPVVLDQWDTSVHNVNATASLATEDIDVTNAGTYRIDVAASFSGSNNTTYTLQVYQNAVAVTTVVGQRRITSGTDVGSMSMGGSIVAAAGDNFDIRVSTDGTGDITVERANFSMIRIA